MIKKSGLVLLFTVKLACASQASSETSALATLGACAELQTAGLVLSAKVSHIHVVAHPLPILDRLELYISALSFNSPGENAFLQMELESGRIAAREFSLAEIPSDVTCAEAMVQVHREHCTEATLRGGWLPEGRSCDPMDLIYPFPDDGHPNDQLLRSLLGLKGAPKE